jgi:hypothetical protein
MKTIALEPFHQLSMAVLLNIQGKCAGLRAKSARFSGHLPTHGRQKRLSRLPLRLSMTDVWKAPQSFFHPVQKCETGILQ